VRGATQQWAHETCAAPQINATRPARLMPRMLQQQLPVV
jgi:hypothetical protein